MNSQTSSKKILVINGPNINMLGIREPHIYGSQSYSELLAYITEKSKKTGRISVSFFQSNHEGAIVDEIQRAYNVFDGIIINAAAYTHTSIAIADAVAAVSIPTVEVHMSNLDTREEFRRTSYLRKYCIGCCYGKGFESYIDALGLLIDAIF